MCCRFWRDREASYLLMRAYSISLDGARAAVQRGAQIRYFPHNDAQALARLRQSYVHIPHKVIICGGVYSSGGHTAALLGLKPGNIVHVGSLSKAFGVPLVFVAGPVRCVHYLRC